jgi:hypothetical protein
LKRRDQIEDHVVTQVLLPFRDEVAARREREAHVKEKYGLRSLDYLIQESNQKLLDYQMRQDLGEQMDMPILNERRNLEGLEGRRRDLEREIRLERNLTVGEPRIIGAAVVVPLPPAPAEALGETVVYPTTAEAAHPAHETPASYETGPPQTDVGAPVSAPSSSAGMSRDDAIEAVGMRVALEYERAQGWHPEDVAAEDLGFDVRSTLYGADPSTGRRGEPLEPSGQVFAAIRYIEVKARAHSGAIRLTANEWKKARQFGAQYWLYVVTQAGTDAPALQRIQNPAAVFQIDEDIFATGFIIPEEKWQGRGSAGNSSASRGTG